MGEFQAKIIGPGSIEGSQFRYETRPLHEATWIPMATEIVFDKDHSLFVDQNIQEVYEGLTDAQEQGTLVTFIATNLSGGNTKRVDVQPGSVRYLLDRDPPSKGMTNF